MHASSEIAGIDAHWIGHGFPLPVSEQPYLLRWAAHMFCTTFPWHAWQPPKVLCRPDTFSLGVCNGCQLMALLGWVPGGDLPDTQQPRFVHNASGRFECRWATVEIRPSPSVLLKAGAYDCPNCQCSRDMSPHILLL